MIKKLGYQRCGKNNSCDQNGEQRHRNKPHAASIQLSTRQQMRFVILFVLWLSIGPLPSKRGSDCVNKFQSQLRKRLILQMNVDGLQRGNL
jgi:hypothetical protein